MSTLFCPVCEIEYEPGADEPWACDDGHPLELQPSGTAQTPDRSPESTTETVWEYGEWIPIPCLVTLGEGRTPEIGSEPFGCTFKLEYVSPSASFKDRGATTMLSRAAELGVTKIVEDSSGNAGSAVAQYAARAGIDAEIYVPADIPAGKRRAIAEAGATVVPVEGSREDVSEACVAAAETGEAWYASHNWRPSFLAGTQTFAYEVAARRNWSVPDVVVLPMGAGTLFLGAYRGFTSLHDRGQIDSIPRLVGAQAAGFSPIADRAGHGVPGERNEIAKGLQTTDPPRKAELIEVTEQEGNHAIAVSQEQTESALADLRHSGFFVEPTSAVAPAAYRQCLADGTVSEDEEVVVALSGSGLNSI